MAAAPAMPATGWRANLVIYAALAANLGIAAAKFVAAAITASSSMLTEGVHSLVDTGNQGLLLYGQYRAKRLPDRDHPFGYGRELYFWAFIVAILIFGLGAGVSIYEGWRHIAAPEPLRDPLVNYVVLAIAFVLEGASWWVAMRAFAARKGDLGWWRAIRESKDPSGFIVLFEDSAALAGLAVAAAGVWASHHWGDPRIDGWASIAIGVILLCLIPIVPNGLVPVFASRTNITYRKFILSVAVGSIPTLLVLAAVGNHLLMGDYFTSIILCIILGTVAGMVYLNQNRIIEMVADFESRIGIGSQNDNTQDKDQN